MIIYKRTSDDNTHIFYENVSNQTIPVTVKIYEGYTGGFIFYSDLDMVPNVEYFTYIYPMWTNRKVMIYHRETGQLLAPFVIGGNKSVEDIDKYGYIKKLFQKETDFSCQSGILDVLREHHFDRQYREYCDIEKGDVVVDVGFNYGMFSLGALYNGASKIYGLEPNRHVYNLVKELYPEQDKVQIYNFAISDKNETLRFKVGYNTLASSIVGNVDDFKEEYDVKCFNFFDFLTFHDINHIDFLKVDCEGTEYEIFNVIPDEYFKTIKKIHVEFHFNDGQKVLQLIDKLEKNGFEWKYEHERDQFSEIGLIFAKNKNI
jgi:FkbM family methyltransferase